MTPGTSSETHRYFFVHIMKTAGTALRRRLANHFEETAVYPARVDGTDLRPYLSVDHLRERLEARGDEIQVVTGHFPLCTVELIDGRCTTLTLLRDPVERTLSYLRFQLRTNERQQGKTLEEIYEQPLLFRSKLDNHMTKMLSLRPSEMRAGMFTLVNIDRADLERAKAALGQIDSVGLQERFEDFCGLLTSRYGWDLGEPRAVNTTEPLDVPESFRSRIAEDNALDVELYEFAKQLLSDAENRSASR